MFREEEVVVFIVMSLLLLTSIFLLLWILWKALTFLINNILIIGSSDEYINDQFTLISNENATVQDEMQMVMFDIESQFRRL